jgi:K+-sensing histidine kinase KdpD
MKISHRLYLTAAASVVGVLAVAALAYRGQYARAIPAPLLVIAVIAAVASSSLSWWSARYVSQRVERLAGASAVPGPDELDTIEDVVDHLSSAVVEAGATSSEREAAARRRISEYATMVATIATESTARLEEVRLPLHILLENRFGDLNENQEEMLGAARTAAEAVDADLIALREIAELDLETRTLRRDRLLPGDLIRSIVPTLQAIADRRHVALAIDLEPLVPALRGDQPRLQDALATLLGGAIREAPEGASLRLSVSRDEGGVRIQLEHGGEGASSIRGALAWRVVAASMGSIARSPEALIVRFPFERSRS